MEKTTAKADAFLRTTMISRARAARGIKKERVRVHPTGDGPSLRLLTELRESGQPPVKLLGDWRLRLATPRATWQPSGWRA